MEHAESSALLVSGWHRMGYNFHDMTTISKELERLIRILHQTLGNAQTDGKFILFGTGSTQLLAAAVNALSHNSSSSSRVVASVPYYAVSGLVVILVTSPYKSLKDSTIPCCGFMHFLTLMNGVMVSFMKCKWSCLIQGNPRLKGTPSVGRTTQILQVPLLSL